MIGVAFVTEAKAVSRTRRGPARERSILHLSPPSPPASPPTSSSISFTLTLPRIALPLSLPIPVPPSHFSSRSQSRFLRSPRRPDEHVISEMLRDRMRYVLVGDEALSEKRDVLVVPAEQAQPTK
eukprot:6179923-Pleurochrysis_carterae.AAC.1